MTLQTFDPSPRHAQPLGSRGRPRPSKCPRAPKWPPRAPGAARERVRQSNRCMPPGNIKIKRQNTPIFMGGIYHMDGLLIRDPGVRSRFWRPRGTPRHRAAPAGRPIAKSIQSTRIHQKRSKYYWNITHGPQPLGLGSTDGGLGRTRGPAAPQSTRTPKRVPSHTPILGNESVQAA